MCTLPKVYRRIKLYQNLWFIILVWCALDPMASLVWIIPGFNASLPRLSPARCPDHRTRFESHLLSFSFLPLNPALLAGKSERRRSDGESSAASSASAAAPSLPSDPSRVENGTGFSHSDQHRIPYKLTVYRFGMEKREQKKKQEKWERK